MHAEVMEFCRREVKNARRMGIPLIRVLDVGSGDMNGSTREIFLGSEYIGIDIHPGRGVDWVGVAHRYPAEAWDGRLFDALVSTECLEHDPHWSLTLRTCAQLVRPGGLVLITCATVAREPHALHLWPDGYYRNLSGPDLHSALSRVAVEGRYQVVRGDEDLQFVGRRGGGLECLSATPVAVSLHEVNVTRSAVPGTTASEFVRREVHAALPPDLSRLADGLTSIRGQASTYDLAAYAVIEGMASHRLLGRVTA